MDGAIEGGWSYVIVVYAASWLVMLGYGGALLLRSQPRQLAARWGSSDDSGEAG